MKEQMGKSFYLQKSCRGRVKLVLFDIINTVPVTATVKVYQMLKSCLIFENVNESVRSASSVTLILLMVAVEG